ncbi:MAG: hypothetical protein WC527_04125 [Candidatus Margulisiibacteriota bacterium]
MKKVLSFALVVALMLSSASFAAPKKTAKKAAPKSAVYTTKKSDLSVSPKVSLYTGNGGSSFAIGCEVAKPIMERVDLMGEVIYVLPNGGVSNIVLSGNGIYKFDKVQGMPGDIYAGGGLNYNILSGSGFSASGIGFQGLVGMDIPAGDGTAFGQLKYVSYSYSVPGVTVPGFGTVGGGTVSASGFVIEGGYRFAL